MPRHLVLYAHPNSKSFCHAMLEAVSESATNAGHTVEVRDLYAMAWDPILKPSDFELLAQRKVAADVAIEQALLSKADYVSVIYPLWWSGLPAILKGYIDRVFTSGFAFKYGSGGAEGLLKDKKVSIFMTMGGSTSDYQKNGMIDAIKHTSDAGIFQFCGMTVERHEIFGGIVVASDAERDAILEKLRLTF